jgi:hypothetical protein
MRYNSTQHPRFHVEVLTESMTITAALRSPTCLQSDGAMQDAPEGNSVYVPRIAAPVVGRQRLAGARCRLREQDGRLHPSPAMRCPWVRVQPAWAAALAYEPCSSVHRDRAGLPCMREAASCSSLTQH